MPWETYRRAKWKGKLRPNFPIPQCDLENRLRSIPRHNPTAIFPWGRRQWAQPSRVYHFRDQGCGSSHSSRIVLLRPRALNMMMTMMMMMIIPGTGLGMRHLWELYIFVLQSSQIAFRFAVRSGPGRARNRNGFRCRCQPAGF